MSTIWLFVLKSKRFWRTLDTHCVISNIKNIDALGWSQFWLVKSSTLNQIVIVRQSPSNSSASFLIIFTTSGSSSLLPFLHASISIAFFLPKCRCRMAKEQHWQRSYQHEGLPAIWSLRNRASPPSPTLTPILYPVCRQPFTIVAPLHPIRIPFNTGTDLSLLLFPRAFERLLRLLGLLRLFSERVSRAVFWWNASATEDPKFTSPPVAPMWCDDSLVHLQGLAKCERLPFVSSSK